MKEIEEIMEQMLKIMRDNEYLYEYKDTINKILSIPIGKEIEEKCIFCEGKGRVGEGTIVSPDPRHQVYGRIDICPKCKGTGTIRRPAKTIGELIEEYLKEGK